MKSIFKGLVCIALLAVLMPSVVNADQRDEEIGASKTGVLSSLFSTHGGVKAALEATVALNEDFGTSTASYNQANGSAATSGWINVEDYNDDMIWGVDLSVLGSTGIDITFEGLLSDDATAPRLIYTKSFSAIDRNYKLSIAEGGLKYIRAGGQATGTDGTNTCSIKLRAEGKRK